MDRDPLLPAQPYSDSRKTTRSSRQEKDEEHSDDHKESTSATKAAGVKQRRHLLLTRIVCDKMGRISRLALAVAVPLSISSAPKELSLLYTGFCMVAIFASRRLLHLVVAETWLSLFTNCKEEAAVNFFVLLPEIAFALCLDATARSFFIMPKLMCWTWSLLEGEGRQTVAWQLLLATLTTVNSTGSSTYTYTGILVYPVCLLFLFSSLKPRLLLCLLPLQKTPASAEIILQHQKQRHATASSSIPKTCEMLCSLCGAVVLYTCSMLHMARIVSQVSSKLRVILCAFVVPVALALGRRRSSLQAESPSSQTAASSPANILGRAASMLQEQQRGGDVEANDIAIMLAVLVADPQPVNAFVFLALAVSCCLPPSQPAALYFYICLLIQYMLFV